MLPTLAALVGALVSMVAATLASQPPLTHAASYVMSPPAASSLSSSWTAVYRLGVAYVIWAASGVAIIAVPAPFLKHEP